MPRSNPQDSRLQRLALLSQMSDQQDKSNVIDQANMMDMIGKLYGINKEQTMLPAQLSAEQATSGAEQARGNYFSAEAANLPGKTEAAMLRGQGAKEAGDNHMMNALYLGKMLGLPPEGMAALAKGADISQYLAAMAPQKPQGNYTDQPISTIPGISNTNLLPNSNVLNDAAQPQYLW